MPVEGKALGDQVSASTEQFSENKECNGVGWLLLTVVKNLGKENGELRALNFQLKICIRGLAASVAALRETLIS